MLVPLDTSTIKFARITHVGRSVFLGSATPLPQGGWALALHNFGGSLLFMCTPFDAKLPNLTGNNCVEVRVSWGLPRLTSQERRVPAIPNFVGSPAYMPTPFYSERPNSAW